MIALHCLVAHPVVEGLCWTGLRAERPSSVRPQGTHQQAACTAVPRTSLGVETGLLIAPCV